MLPQSLADESFPMDIASFTVALAVLPIAIALSSASLNEPKAIAWSPAWFSLPIATLCHLPLLLFPITTELLPEVLLSP